MIITIDGADGVGKTTLARKLSAHYGFNFISKPVYSFYNQCMPVDKKRIDELQHHIYDETDSDFLKSYFTNMSLLYLKEHIGDRNIIIDRGLLSSYIHNGNNETDPLYEVLVNQGLLFDYALLLYCDSNQRIERIKKRNCNDSDLENESIYKLNYEKVFEFIGRHHDLPIDMINTTYLTEDQVFNYAVQLIDERLLNMKNKVMKKELGN